MTNDASTLTLPVCLIVMDGFGIAPPDQQNAIALADTPILDEVFDRCPKVLLEASGEAVGLPAGQMGNSEVGHLNIGAGRVVHQELSRINRACADGSLSENKVLQSAMDDARARGGSLHVMGLLSDGGVHSSIEHLFSLLLMARDRGVEDVRVHCFMDGRDVPPKSGGGYIEQLEAFIDARGLRETTRIASMMGRYYAMDRDKRWDRVERAYATLVDAAPLFEGTPAQAISASYVDGVTDEFVEPVAFDDRGMRDGDAVVFFNFRPDRAREITRAIVDEDFDGFARARHVDVSYVCLTEYDPTIDAPVAFPKTFPDNVLADVVSAAGLRQYHIAETEKYAHVTFFLNGGVEEPKPCEQRTLVASPKVATYDLQPEMSEPAVAQTLAAAIESHEADIYIVNFANCDMVGHTGDIPAAVAAVEAVDSGVGVVLDALAKVEGVALITADHGNADKMVSENGAPHTAHTTAVVPLALVDTARRSLGLRGASQSHSKCEAGGRTWFASDDAPAGALCDIAPTLLDIVGIPCPSEMTGKSLLERR